MKLRRDEEASIVARACTGEGVMTAAEIAALWKQLFPDRPRASRTPPNMPSRAMLRVHVRGGNSGGSWRAADKGAGGSFFINP